MNMTLIKSISQKKLAEANAVMRKVCLPKEFFAEKETTKEMQIA